MLLSSSAQVLGEPTLLASILTKTRYQNSSEFSGGHLRPGETATEETPRASFTELAGLLNVSGNPKQKQPILPTDSTAICFSLVLP